jgi:virginiamycin B lyase
MNTIAAATRPTVSEFALNWPSPLHGSTHELALGKDFIFVTGQNMDLVAKCNYQGEVCAYYPMPAGSGPHGLLIDKFDRLWVSLEFAGLVVQLDKSGAIVLQHDVRLFAEGAGVPINTAPHGIGLDADGETIWFTGKRTSTVGRIHPNGRVDHFQLNTLAALPIILQAGPDGGIWGSELLGNAILHVSRDGQVREFATPTRDSGPIGVVPDPTGNGMWFTEGTGMKIGKIDLQGNISEFPVPAFQKTDTLASLCFDRENNLWVQVYVDQNSDNPDGTDYVVMFDKSIRDMPAGEISGVPVVTYALASKGSMMHRIKLDLKGNLWFTEMMTDKLGRIALGKCV